MRRPAQQHYGPIARHGWAHPYSGIPAMAVFYNDGGDPPPAPPVTDPAAAAEPPKPGPPAQRTFTQAEVEALAAREKAQGKRAAAREFAEKHGFNSIEDAEQFIAAARQAEDAKKTEEQKRQEELDRREQELAAKEAAATARERAAIRKAAVLGLGATGDDLADALAILERDLAATPDADEAAVTVAAEALKARRPALFGAAAPAQAPNALPPAPGGAPAGGPPARQAPAGKPGDRGREMARLRGHIKDSNAA